MANQEMVICTMEEFAELLQSRVSERMGAAYSVQVQNVQKNNGVTLTGLTIRAEEQSVAPTIYLERAYDCYKDGMDIDGICEELIQAYKSTSAHSMDFSFLKDFSWVKGNVYCKLINRASNAEMLKETPYIEFLDLAVVAYIRFSDPRIGSGNILVRNTLLEQWEITSDVMFAFAMQNTKTLLGEKVTAMSDVLKEVGGQGDGEENMKKLDEMQKAIPLYVASNNDNCLGAVVILDNGFLRSFADKIRGDYYILPSSVHETLFLPASYGDAAAFKEMVASINATEVDACEVLSDNVYLFSRKSGRVEIV